VGDPAIFDIDTFPALRALEQGWETICAEIDPMLAHLEQLPNLRDISPDQKRIATDDRWKSFVLYGFGARSERHAALCPETMRLVEQVPGLESAWFSILLPGYHVPEHRGITKGLVTSLLGVHVPEKRDMCWIRIGDETLHYEDGRCIVFDDTVAHEIYNQTDQIRVVLIVDFRRPLRPLGRAFNELFLWVFKRTGYVTEAKKLYLDWEDRFHAFLEQRP